MLRQKQRPAIVLDGNQRIGGPSKQEDVGSLQDMSRTLEEILSSLDQEIEAIASGKRQRTLRKAKRSVRRTRQLIESVVRG